MVIGHGLGHDLGIGGALTSPEGYTRRTLIHLRTIKHNGNPPMLNMIKHKWPDSMIPWEWCVEKCVSVMHTASAHNVNGAVSSQAFIYS